MSRRRFLAASGGTAAMLALPTLRSVALAEGVGGDGGADAAGDLRTAALDRGLPRRLKRVCALQG